MTVLGYDRLDDGINGESFFVQRSTGEVFPPVTVCVPAGTQFKTPEEQEKELENRKRKQEAAQQREEREFWKQYQRENHTPLGDFYFIPTVETFSEVTPEMVTRLIYLCTFLQLDSGRLMMTRRTPMRRIDLPKVLSVSKSTARRFWEMVSPQYVTEAKDGFLMVNKGAFKRGRISKKEHLQLMKFYIDGVRTLYRMTDSSKHNRLGELFKLLPFINIEWNLLCYPEYAAEKDLDKVELLSMAEFCRLIHYDVSHLNDLVSTLRSITFEVNGRRELFCSIVYDGVQSSGARICINPNILYSGTDPEKVKVLGALCRTT